VAATIETNWRISHFLRYQMFSSAKAEEEPAWTGFAMEQIMKTLSFVNSSLVQAPREEKEKLAHKLDDTLYCAKVTAVMEMSQLSDGMAGSDYICLL